MKLIKYIIRRILWLIPVIIGVTIIAFLVTRILPGDPIQLLLGDNISDQIKQMYIEKWGLDQPLYIQYFYYLRDLLHGDLGTSYLTNNAVAFDLMKRLPATLELIIMAMIISVVIGITAGIVAAINRNNIFDHITRVFVLIGTILPPFWLGLLLIYFFFFLAGVAPAPSGRLPMGANFVADGTGFILVDTLMAGRVDLFWMALKQMTLPVITIVLETLAAICKLTRSSMISTMNMEYIKMARASGIPSTIIYGRYSLKNGLLPVITSVGMTFSFAVGGEVLVEKIFSWPGIGLYAIKALGVSDYPAIQGFVLTCALIYLVVFLIVDLLYFAVDPRIKY